MLYIVRHATTDWNEKKKLQGQTDIPLNEAGKNMALLAKEKYKDLHFDVCYSSPLKRAVETAQILIGDRVPIILDNRLLEMNMGVFEGFEKSFEKPSLPINELFFHPESYKAVEGGEELSDLFKRTGEFLNEVVYPKLKENKDILIVGHGIMNLSIISQILGTPLKDLWSGNISQCEIFRLI